jgi:serine/threonine protein kinase
MSMIGKTLAHYQITAEIGKGGMGEVYQATDTKLGRSVAIKVLPEEFAKDADRVARFQREAKLLASLNHPNIAAIHGLEEADGTHFLVLELVEGQTLAERIQTGPMDVEEALKLALQIAEALEAAHEKGVIHRDLKPANIKVTPDDKVKVLDFGLAKAFAGEQSDPNLSNSPTLSHAATMKGVILGTAAYMSPEQARGKTVDKRADIWAFGAVLFEMLTGKSAFQGEDISEILASVIKGDSNMSLLPANIHARICEVLERCLQKDLRKRYADIADARYEIEQVLADPGGVFVLPVTASESPARSRLMLPWVVAILGILIAGSAVWFLKPMEPKRVIRLECELPEDQQFSNPSYMTMTRIDISPDGNLLAYSTPEGIYLRSLDSWTADLLEQTEGAVHPFFSPDSRWIGFQSEAEGKLKKIAVSGGAPVELSSSDFSFGYSWTEDNRILQTEGPRIQWISSEGGKWQTLFGERGGMLSNPQMLPDGESVLYTSRTAESQLGNIMVRSLHQQESRKLFDGRFARYVKTGHIVYVLENDLYAVPFDSDTLEVTGSHKPIVIGVMGNRLVSNYAVSDSGTLAYLSGTIDSIDDLMFQRTLVWVDLNGNEESLPVSPDQYCHPRISPDGRQAAYTVGGATDSKIWIQDLVRNNRIQLTPDSFSAVPLWTLEGKHVAFASNNGIYRKAANGTGESELLGSDYGRTPMPFPSSWSGDGKSLLFMGFGIFDGSASWDIGVFSMEGDNSHRPLFRDTHLFTEPKISPEGKWIAYTSDETGQTEVYVCPYPVVDEVDRRLVSTNGGYSPLWSPDSRELYYRNGDAVMAVKYVTEPTFKLDAPRVLFRGSFFPQPYNYMPAVMNSWDIDPNGNRFLMIRSAQNTDEESAAEKPHKINIVLNWFEELKNRVPVN